MRIVVTAASVERRPSKVTGPRCCWQYVLAAVLRSGGYSRKELEAKEKDELYKLRVAALKRMVRSVCPSVSHRMN